jgi:transposase
MLTLSSAVKIFICTQPTDMRCGFNKLSMLAENYMRQDPFSGHLFVFFNKCGDKCKILFWDRTGFAIYYKRLEEGTFEKLAASPGQTSLEVDIAQLTWILEGIDLFKTRRRRRYEHKNRVLIS